MKIFACLFVYNERPYLPEFIEYYRSQGCDFVFVDNMSTDGTYEYLLKQRMRVVRFDTNGMFELPMLQKALIQEIHKVKPDWFIYTAADMYFIFDEPIKEMIWHADKQNYNYLLLKVLEVVNTGEKFALPMQNHFFYGVPQAKVRYMVAKYHPDFKIVADAISLPDQRPKMVNGVIVNYGACKPKEQSIEKLKRRRKAWENGMHKVWGGHYLDWEKRNWVWDKKECVYIPDTEYWKYIQKIMVK